MQPRSHVRAGGLQVLRTSCLYKSAAMYVEEQAPFYNAAALVATQLPPLALLDAVKRVEEAAGRNLQGQRWGPRPLDIDIIFYEGPPMADTRLQVPHVRWRERPFVWQPASELLRDGDAGRLPVCAHS